MSMLQDLCGVAVKEQACSLDGRSYKEYGHKEEGEAEAMFRYQSGGDQCLSPAFRALKA